MVELIIFGLGMWFAWHMGAAQERAFGRDRQCPRCKYLNYSFRINEIEQDGKLYSFEGFGKLGEYKGQSDVPEGFENTPSVPSCIVDALIKEVQEDGNSKSD